jgi:hypothetical protein
MKVVVRTSSLFLTILSIILHLPISRVRRTASGTRREPPDGLKVGQPLL